MWPLPGTLKMQERNFLASPASGNLPKSPLRYRGQVVFPARLEIHTGIVRAGSRGFEMHCSMWNESGSCVCEGSAEIIWFDFIKQKPARLPAGFSERFNI
jgi:acyl-CoA thioesterase FadM